MNIDNSSLSVADTYLRLVEVIRNDSHQTLDKVGSKIVGCTVAVDGIEDLFEKYPALEEIADVGSDLEYQGEEYFDEYHERLNILIKRLSEEMEAKQSK